MYTLVYFNGQFNRPNTLLPFLHANVGMSPQIQIDCIMPYKGSVELLMDDVCSFLSKLDSHIEVIPNVIPICSSERIGTGRVVNYLVAYIDVRLRKRKVI